jgi:transposase
MPRKQHIVRLTEADRTTLRAMVRHGQQSAWVLQRARLLLQTDSHTTGPGLSDAAAAAAVAVSSRTVARTRAAWCTRGWAALERRPRSAPPTPAKLDQAQETRLIALACSTPPAGIARWSLRLLAARAIEIELVETISHETVRQVLKKTYSSLGTPSAS